MKRLFYFFIIIASAAPLQAQILNGSFESWSSGEPVGWFTNNIPQLSAYPVTQSSISHSGSSSLKGEVVGVDAGGQQYPYAPNLASGDMNNNYFPFHSRPDIIKGLYNFQPVGGDGLQASIVIGNGSTALGSGQVTTYAPTGTGWHDLVFNMFYADTVSQPTLIYIFFTIVPPPGGTNPHIGSVFYLDDFPKVTLIKPAEEPTESFTGQTVFISGETDTIKWNSDGTEYVDIAYSVDEGASYTNIVQNYSGSENRYFWDVPDNITPTRKAKIKVTDAVTGTQVHSINFTIKPWQLTRIVNDELELYEPNQDGWVFENGATNMWPLAWWTQFSYVGIDPYTGIRYPPGYPFSIANPWDFPDWPLFVEVFDTTQCYTSAQFGLYNTAAEDIWPKIDNRNYKGSCFGFSITSLLAFYYRSELQSYFPGIGSFNQLYDLPLNDARRKIINNFYLRQYGQDNLDYRRGRENSVTAQQTLQELKDMFRLEDGDGRPLAIATSSGGHSVVPYKLERAAGSTFDLLVYDNQAAGISQVITIDSVQDRWFDQTTANLGQGQTGCYLEYPCGYYLYTNPVLPSLPGSPADNPSSSGLDGIIIYNTVNAGVNITSSSGHSIGFQDSVNFGDIQDGIPIIPLTGGYQPPVGYYIPDDQYSIQMDNFSDSIAYALFITGTALYDYQRFDPGAGETDLLGYSSEGVTMSNPDQVPKSFNFQTVLPEGASAERVFSADNLALSSGDSIHIRESESSTLVIQNYGQNSTYNLTISASSAAGRSAFFHNSVPLDQNSGHQIVPDWNNLENSPVKILIDYGNDGTIDDSIFVDNQTVGIDNGIVQTVPAQFRLLQNYPNPFNPSTAITFDLPEQSRVTLTVYNILGEQVAELINRDMKAGRHSADFNAYALSSGIYFYRLSTESYTETMKMILIK